MKPFKLWTTFMHEFSHACAAWLSCHEVTGIEVHADEGGLTHWKGRNVECAKHIVLPAGYLGSTIWGSLTLLSCSDGLWMRVMGCALCAALAVCLSYACCGQTKDPSDKWPLVGICIGFGIVLGTLTVFSFLGIWSGAGAFLEALLLWVGTLNLLYATIDVYDDTVRRSDERSDAYQYSKIWPCCFPQCVGFTWFVIALAIFGSSIFAVIWIAREKDDEITWDNFLPGPLVLLTATSVQWLIPCISQATGQVKESKPLLG